MRPRDGERDAAQDRLGPHRSVSQPQRVFYASIWHAPDDRTVPHLLHPLQDFLDVTCSVHTMDQAQRPSEPGGQAVSHTT